MSGDPLRTAVNADQLRTAVSRVLTIGVVVSAVLIGVGFAASFVVGWSGSLLGSPDTTAPVTEFAGLASGLAALRPQAIGQLGLVVLVATPIVRVATSLVGFLAEGDRLYVAITAVVLAILLASALFIR